MIDSRYIASSSLQELLVDKITGLPLAGGTVRFYRDADKTTPKAVYALSGNGPDYTFVPLPNPVQLSAVGTPQNQAFSYTPIYYLPFLVDENGAISTTTDLYYVRVYNSDGAFQYDLSAWPPIAQEGEPSPPVTNQVVGNLIPDGQFLTHLNLNTEDDVIPGGSTDIAYGGWTFELPAIPASTNTLEFVAVGGWTANPPQSPPFQVQIACGSPSSADTIKSLRVKFNDVNKFANDRNYTFGFSAMALSSFNVFVNIVKYFGVGGTSFISEPIAELTIDTQQKNFSIPVNFGDNSGTIEGTGQTYIGIEISFPVASLFQFTGTNFILTPGTTVINNYPSQTNADTLTRAVDGWTNVPDYDGFDLYLPKVLTKYGYKYDDSQVGDVGTTSITVLNPSVYETFDNKMPTLGDTFIYDDYALNGIPFARLGAKLISDSPVAGIPKYGTGDNYATSYLYAGSITQFRLTVNSNGTPSAAASDGNTGWGFKVGAVYGGVSTGSGSIGYNAYTNLTNGVLAVGSFVTPLASASAGTSGFTVTAQSYATGLLAQQNYAIIVTCVNAATVAPGAGAGKYFLFSNSTKSYYMWFASNAETDPAVAGRTGIKVILPVGGTDGDVAASVREAMNAFQISIITPAGLPTTGQYWLFSANPASQRLFYVWYMIDGSGIDPMVAGRIGISVNLSSSDTVADIINKTYLAVNRYQYAAPNFQDMFFRMNSSGLYDADVGLRWSTISGMSGAVAGTNEYSQFRNHTHVLPSAIAQITGSDRFSIHDIAYPTVSNTNLSTNATGGSETRPVNTALIAYIRY